MLRLKTSYRGCFFASDLLTKDYPSIISTMEKMYSDQVYGVEEVVSE